MDSPRLGLIGTGMITQEFAAATKAENAFELVAVMSRSSATARSFIEDADLDRVVIATEISELLGHSLDAVYIASPNSFHKNHALAAIDAGVNVMVEKPAFWNPAQWQEVHRAAERAGVLVFEAARHLFEPGFETVGQWVDEQKSSGREVTGASLNFHQYSSRWDAVLAGQEPNIFSLRHGGGALVDLGIYTVYAAVAWFGEPQAISYRAQLAPTGVDAAGVLLLTYPGFTAELSFSKNQVSRLPNEIRAGRSGLVLNAVQGIDRVKTVEGQTLFEAEKPGAPLSQLMRSEALAFAELIAAQRQGNLTAQQGERYRYLTQLSRTVNRICTEARHQAGIVFSGEVDSSEKH